MTARRETQQRAAMAILSIIVVIGLLGAGVYFVGGHSFPGGAIASFEAGQQALATAEDDITRVLGPGVDLVANDPNRAATLLADAIKNLNDAASAGISAATIAPLRSQAVAAIDRLYHMTSVGDAVLFTFPSGKTAINLRAIVEGPDGAPYVLDAGTKAVYRIDLRKHTASVVFKAGNQAPGGTEGTPQLMTVGARDLVILDSKSVLWRWRPADANGHGTTARIRVIGASEWGSDVRAIGTFIRNADAGLYNLYVVDPSQQQILAYTPAIDGSGFPSTPSGRLAAPRDVSGVSAMYIDGDIWLADTGKILRIVNGQSEGWTAADPGDEAIRAAPEFTLVTSGSDRRVGQVYGFDVGSQRVIAYLKTDGSFVGQYRLAGGSTGWSDLRDWYVVPGVGDAPDTLIWISANAIHQTSLQPVAAGPAASPGASASPSTRPSIRPSARP